MIGNKFNCIIIGLGSMGSATSYYLSKAGVTVLGLEQFSIPNNRGSHSGESRLIRKAYFEHADYVPLLERAYQNWDAIEKESQEKIFYANGLAYHGNEEDNLIGGIKESSSLYNIPLERDTVSHKFFNLGDRKVSIFEKNAGFLLSDVAIKTIVNLAENQGAKLHGDEKVNKWFKKGSDIYVETDLNNYICKKLIITAGSYIGNVVLDTTKELKMTRQLLAWFKPTKLELHSEDKFPCWVLSRKQGGIYYGFPHFQQSKFQGIKAGIHFPGTEINANEPKENIDIVKNELKQLKDEIHSIIPNLESEIIAWETCRYSMTKDQNFIIDFLPESNQNVVIAGGFSGHGFKFVPVVGEVLADLALIGRSEFNLEMFSINRFE